MIRRPRRALLAFVVPALLATLPGVGQALAAQEAGSRLLRQPDLSADRVAFTHGADVWVAPLEGGRAVRLTSTPAVEADPRVSPDGRWIAFTSNRSGTNQVYLVSAEGGQPGRLTWYPASSHARGWSPDGSRVLYSSTRQTAPSGHERLWTVSAEGGPSELVPAPWGHSGSWAPDGRRLVVDRMSRWDVEFRDYRGGQNTPLVILDTETLEETLLPNEDRTTDTHPVWMGDRIYFVSDRDFAYNVWSYDPASGALEQLTGYSGAEVKHLSGNGELLALEQDGWIHTLDPATGATERLAIEVTGDFPWAETRWEDVTPSAGSGSLSPTGQRALFSARGEIFTVPVEHGDPRNLSRTSDAADRAPVWSPDGAQVAWFSDASGGNVEEGYELLVADQDGLTEPRRIDIGASAMAWEVTWSPDGEHIAFVDDDVRIRVVELASGEIRTVDTGRTQLERGSMGLTWSPDSRWLAYAKTQANNFRRIMALELETGQARPLTNDLADAMSPAWDRDGRHLYFLASTDLGLNSGWANTSTVQAQSPTYAAWVMVLRDDDPTPFPLRSDEEPIEDEEEADEIVGAPAAGGPGEAAGADAPPEVRIDFEGVDRRIVALPVPVREYRALLAGPAGSVFIGEAMENGFGLNVLTFALDEREATPFLQGVSSLALSADAGSLLYRQGESWHVVETARPPEPGSGPLEMTLRMELDREAEWRQMFDEAWRYEEEFFYDQGMHGADWDAVHARYSPLVDHVRHRADLTYLLDQMNGEMSVGHSFVFGGDYPAVDTSRVGLLGADFTAEDGGWRIERIYTFESWNPGLSAPLDQPGLDVDEGDFLVGVNGEQLDATMDPWRLLDGTAERQTVLHLNDQPGMEGSRTVTVEPIRSESQLRQRAWVEDNRRRVDELSGGRVAYAWVPNTGGPGVVSFDRYFFAQQDKEAAVIDERYNGGGLLDDYMVDYMTRELRAAITNDIPGGEPMVLPQGVLGPKVLLVNELAGSGGDYFPWAFRQQEVGPLVGMRTWGGLVASSVHYALVDGGALTAPTFAVFDPVNGRFIAENEGVPPDIRVWQDAAAVAEGRDPQLERAVEEALRLLEENPLPEITVPPPSRPSRPGGGGR